MVRIRVLHIQYLKLPCCVALFVLALYEFANSSLANTLPADELSTTNACYRERFPRATAEMESCLISFLDLLGVANDERDPEAAEVTSSTPLSEVGQPEQHTCFASKEALLSFSPVMRFATAQLAEIARDCLQRSRDGLLSSRYFTQMNENLENLLNEVCHFLLISYNNSTVKYKTVHISTQQVMRWGYLTRGDLKF